METKICTKCQIEKAIEMFYKKRGACKSCIAKVYSDKMAALSESEYAQYQQELWKKQVKKKLADPESYKIKNKKLYAKHNKRIKIRSKQQKLEDPLAYREYMKIHKRERIYKISDLYIKELLSGKCELQYKDITLELIIVKRKQIQIKREIKKYGN